MTSQRQDSMCVVMSDLVTASQEKSPLDFVCVSWDSLLPPGRSTLASVHWLRYQAKGRQRGLPAESEFREKLQADNSGKQVLSLPRDQA